MRGEIGFKVNTEVKQVLMQKIMDTTTGQEIEATKMETIDRLLNYLEDGTLAKQALITAKSYLNKNYKESGVIKVTEFGDFIRPFVEYIYRNESIFDKHTLKTFIDEAMGTHSSCILRYSYWLDAYYVDTTENQVFRIFSNYEGEVINHFTWKLFEDGYNIRKSKA